MAAARAAARAGTRPLLVQLGPIGGDCTFTGCVPSKALFEAAARGGSFDGAKAAIVRAITTIAAREDDGVLRSQGIEVLHGWARFRAPDEIDVEGTAFRSRRIVIATGALPAVPPIDGLAHVDYLTNETVFELDRLPVSLAVLGGGAIGCELAQAFRRLGAEVTIIEALPRLLSGEEPETSEAIAGAFIADGIVLRVGRSVVRAEPLETKGAARLHLDDGDVITAERVLVAVGRNGAIAGLDLDAVGVATDRGFVRVDDRLATTAAGIWAVGDVTGMLQFTHAADEMGRVAVANALSRAGRRRVDPSAIPWVTFTAPEVGRVGMTEAEAADHGARSFCGSGAPSTAPSRPCCIPTPSCTSRRSGSTSQGPSRSKRRPRRRTAARWTAGCAPSTSSMPAWGSSRSTRPATWTARSASPTPGTSPTVSP